jgi:hypothetical protein
MSVWRSEEIKMLARLRDGFLSGSAGAQDYWSADDELSLYERTFAQRIGWKWDAVLSELALRKWKPPARRLVDWDAELALHRAGCLNNGLLTLRRWCFPIALRARVRSPAGSRVKPRRTSDVRELCRRRRIVRAALYC